MTQMTPRTDPQWLLSFSSLPHAPSHMENCCLILLGRKYRADERPLGLLE